MSIQLFPHVLVRVAGDTFSHFEKLHFDAVFTVAAEIFSCKQALKTCKQELSDILYAVITISEPEMQKKLLNAKRDVFNGRTLSEEKTALLRQYLPGDTQPEGAKALETYLSLKSRIQELTDKGEKLYHDEFIARRGALKELIQGKSFQEGLLLSSQSLLTSIHDHYLKLDPEKFTNKDRQTEKGLVKYLSRMYSKTTPFSTFTNLTMAAVGEGVQHQAQQHTSVFHTPKDSKAHIKSHIRLNNFLYQFLKALLTKSPAIARCLPIRPNPTIQKTATHFLFLTNSNNVEAFQRIPPSPILDLFLELIGEYASGLTIRDFAKIIIDGEYIEAETEQIEAYIKQLVEYGFFEYNIGVSGIDPDWDIKLREQLAPLTAEFPLLGELSTVLERIRGYAEQYGTSPLSERKRILTEAHSLFRAVCMNIHKEAGLPEDERKTPEERAAEARQKMKEEQEKAKAKKAEEAKAGEAKVEETKLEETKEEIKDQSEQDADGDSEEKKEEAFKHQSNTYFSYKPEQMFYEDSTFEVQPTIAHDELLQLCTTLHTLQQTLWTFGGMKDEQDTMRHFFTQKYGTEATVSAEVTVDLITFYEEYFREWKKPEAERQQKAREEQARKAREKQEQEKLAKEQTEKAQAEKAETQVKAPKEALKETPEEKNTAEEKPVPEAPVIPSIKERQERNKAWTDKYAEVLRGEIPQEVLASNAETIHLRFDPVRRVTDELQYPAPREVESRSYGMFVQFFRERDSNGEERLMGVVNASLSGFGKMISRFMHIFDASVTEDVRSWNSARAGEAMFIEDCDASYFNANLHPPLMPHEIWMPGGHNTLPAEKQIPVTDLQVRLSADGERLELLHKTLGKTAYVFDLGFQGHGGRSQLFQLLEKFTRAEYLSFYPLLNALSSLSAPKPQQQTLPENAEQQPNETPKDAAIAAATPETKPQPRVRTRPRVVYEEQLVLQRKAWFVPKELLPLRTKQETDWQYFERLNTWRSELGMPEEIFLFVNPRENQNNQENIDTDAAKRVTRDDYKPQYISFRNPFMVKLFEGLLAKVMSVLKIEEMLPNSRQMAEIAGQKYVTECVVQWYV